MRQLIIGADVDGPFTSAAEGSLSIQYIQNSGVPALANVATAGAIKDNDSQFRFVRRGASDAEAEVASPWFRPSDFKSWTSRMYNAGVDQIIKVDCSAGDATLKEFQFKVIVTTSGYEPFSRYTFTTKAAASAADTASAMATEIQAQVTAGNCPEIASAALASTDQVHITMAAGERAQIAVDVLESACVFSEVAGTSFVFPVGTYAKLLKEEVEQQGREWSNYDRYTALPDENKTYAVSSEVYNEHTFRFVNSAEGQIRGVDNMREIKIAIPYEAKGASDNNYADGGSSGDSGQTFELIVAALFETAVLHANGD